MTISLIRIDDRIIHGQVVTRWSRERKCDGILAVDDKVAKDKVLSMVLKNAAPIGIKAGIFTIEEFLQKFKAAKESSKNYFLIVKTPVTLAKIIEQGISFDNKINVGPMSAREGTTTIGQNVCITQEEAEAFEELHTKGYDIEFQLVPDSKLFTWQEAREKK